MDVSLLAAVSQSPSLFATLANLRYVPGALGLASIACCKASLASMSMFCLSYRDARLVQPSANLGTAATAIFSWRTPSSTLSASIALDASLYASRALPGTSELFTNATILAAPLSRGDDVNSDILI